MSYLLKNKESETVLSKIKSFISTNGPCQIFQTDNGLEFNNVNLKVYLENLNIKFIRGAPYHPQSNGCCEALHKQIKLFLLEEYENNKNYFDIDISIENVIEAHNNMIHTSTKYKPVELRDVKDENSIDEVINNIINSMKRKLKDITKCPKNTLLLLNSDLVLKGKIYHLKKKGKKNFTIPCLLREYINNDTIIIKILITIDKYEYIKKNAYLNVNIDTCRIIDDYGFSYYMQYYGENFDYTNIEQILLSENSELITIECFTKD